MSSQTIAIVAFGDIGERLCRRLEPDHWQCYGLRRRAEAVAAPARGVAVDLQRPESLVVLEAMAPDALLVALTPTERSVDGYKRGFSGAMQAIVDGLGEHRPQRAFFVSSTRVYAPVAGGWVDEDSPLAEADPYASAIIAAERCLIEALDGAMILRAGGLYSDSSTRMLDRVSAGTLTPAAPLRYSNRIHREDLAAFIAHALQAKERVPSVDRVINLVDGQAAPIQEVERWLCGEIGVAYAPPAPVADAPAAPAHKRIRSQVLGESGFRLQYPDYQSGYAGALAHFLR